MRLKVKADGHKSRGKRVLVKFRYKGRYHSLVWRVDQFCELLLASKGGGADNLGGKGPIAFDEYAKTFERHHGRNLGSWEIWMRHLVARLVEIFGKTPIHRIDKIAVESLKARLVDEGLAGATVNRYLAVLGSMLSRAENWGYLRFNPRSKVTSLPEQGRERAMTWEEYQTLLAHCDSWLKPLVIVAVNTGLREGKLLGLKWTDIDFGARLVTVLKTKINRPDRKIEPRRFPLNAPAYETLQSITRHIKSPFVFHQDGRRIKDFRTRWSSTLQRAEIQNLRFHDLRHTFATWLAQRGFDIKTIMELTDHTDPQVAMRYTNPEKPHLRMAVESIATPAPVRFPAPADKQVGTEVGTDRPSEKVTQ